MKDKEFHMEVSRRGAIKASFVVVVSILFFPLAACNRRFNRPKGMYYLGEVKEFLFEETFVREKSFLVVRDMEGWGAMSARCTKEGCDLTYQERNLLCPCCNSVYSLDGKVEKGPASHPLPWYQVGYDKNKLTANTGNEVKPSARFTTPEIEAALVKLRKELKEKDIDPNDPTVRIPKVLLGSESGLKSTIIE